MRRLLTIALFATGALALGPTFQALQGWMETGGYFVLFGLLFACGLGLPLPEDVPLILSGALVHQGTLRLVPVCIVAWCGIMAGDLMLYHLGKKLGPGVTKLPVIGRHITEKRLEKLQGQFEKYGIWVVAIGRLFAGIRGAMVVTAGTLRYSLVKFIIADGIAAVVSGGMFIALGVFLGKNLPALMAKVEHGKRLSLEILGLIIVGLGIWYLVRQRMNRRKSAGNNPPQSIDPVASAPLPSDKSAPAEDDLLRKSRPIADKLS